MRTHRVAITGLGMATSLGPDVPTCWRRLRAGENGIRTISLFDPSQYACTVAGEICDIPVDGFPSVPLDQCRRTVRVFLHVAREAHRDAGLDGANLPSHRVGVAVGTSVNYVHMKLLRHHFQFRRDDGSGQIDLARFAREGDQPSELFTRRQGDFLGTATAKMLGVGGPNFVVDTACAASGHAIGEAFRLIQTGRADAMIAGGACAIVSPVAILAFAILGALSRNANPDQASRPFDKNRDGFVMGEGGGAVVLERYDHAVRRGAKIYGELVGCGVTMSAQNLTDPSIGGTAEGHAIALALEEASLTPSDIDYVAAHGTSTRKNDAIETAAIKSVFKGESGRIMVSSNKGQIGHTISAAGVCNLICAAKAIEEQRVPPTAHYEDPDPECDLDYVPNVGREAPVRAALVNAFAFGGQNIVFAVKQPQ